MSGMTRSMPNISSSGNMRPQSMTTISSPYSKTYMFLPISPTPPSGMMRSGWSLGVVIASCAPFLEERQLVGIVGRLVLGRTRGLRPGCRSVVCAAGTVTGPVSGNIGAPMAAAGAATATATSDAPATWSAPARAGVEEHARDRGDVLRSSRARWRSFAAPRPGGTWRRRAHRVRRSPGRPAGRCRGPGRSARRA